MGTRTGLERQPMTTGLVERVSFDFFTEEELLQLSVKQLSNPVLFDNLNNPVPNGLYDLALGPYESGQSCSTCGLGFLQCPGHFGHVNLEVPAYHPLVFGLLVRLLRSVCLHCHRFRLNAATVHRFAHRIRLLAQGRLVQAENSVVDVGGKASEKVLAELGDELAADGAKGRDGSDGSSDVTDDEGELGPDEERRRRSAASGGASCSPRSGGRGAAGLDGCGGLIEEALKTLRDEFFKAQPHTKCQNCHANNPQLKAMGNTKVFMQPLKGKFRLQNEAQGVSIRSMLEEQAEPDAQLAAIEAEATEELRRAAEDAQRARRGEDDKDEDRDDKDEGEEGKEDDSMDLDGKEGKGVKGSAAAAAKRGNNKRGRHTALDDDEDEDEDEDSTGARLVYMSSSEVYAIMERVWAANPDILSLMFAGGGRLSKATETSSGGKRSKYKQQQRPHPSQRPDGWRMFFLRVVPVAPNMYRRPSRVRDQLYEHAQNTVLTRILNTNLDLLGVFTRPLPDTIAGKTTSLMSPEEQRQVRLSRALAQAVRLQEAVNNLMDSSKVPNSASAPQGIKQALEKKEGIFRMNMMGKRVNFAARSVISPDPYIGTDEIGIPAGFAMTLSFPERVTAWNAPFLRQLVINGPHKWPGAVAVESADGTLIYLNRCSPEKREAIAKQLLSGVSDAGGLRGGRTGTAAAAKRRPLLAGARSAVVYRHVLNGDLMLTNRQPTLHKPSLMAHSARIFHTSEKTIRLHYANCSTFNADFDGDEINLHLPQDQLCRAEGYGIVHADHQYIVPTAGQPIRGLIQDHIIAGVLLTCRDTFLPRRAYCQLVYTAVTVYSPPGSTTLAERPIRLCAPALVKPAQLWTGKQVISTVLHHLTAGLPPMTMTCKGKVPPDYWGKGSGEGELNLHRGELVAGTMDKAQYGKYGLVHAFHELYGGKATDQLLNAFSRLFTYYLQVRGFTCGMDDLLLLPGAESARSSLLAGASTASIAAAAKYVGLKAEETMLADAHKKDPQDVMRASERVRSEVGSRWGTLRDKGAGYDMNCTGALHPIASSVVKSCLPSGQAKPFPANCMSLMTTTGAKGSVVNFSQISCLLGQQELEGRRVPRLPNGKTLPCFSPFDATARADGFITDRFLSGLRPQEYYFHCMAGREGLVDTTVKTARSGYLQRCIIKNLEALRVHYDCSVRNDTDGSIVQFHYGEDGVDVMDTGYLNRFDFAAANVARLAQKLAVDKAVAGAQVAGTTQLETAAQAMAGERQRLLASARSATDPAKAARREARCAADLPVASRFPATLLGVTSERFADALARYCEDNPDGLLHPGDGVAAGAAGGGKAARKERKRRLKEAAKAGGGGGAGTGSGAGGGGDVDPLSPEAFHRLMEVRFMRALAAPGEAVGVLAGQSIGEPSTQMTLNTFHMAGRGEANVTLGIPRLRELFMTASKQIKTPVMTLPLREGLGQEAAKQLTRRLRCIRFGEAIRDMRVTESVVDCSILGVGVGREYRLSLTFHPESDYPDDVDLPWEEVVDAASAVFVPRLQAIVKRQLKGSGKVQFATSETVPSGSAAEDAQAPGAASNRAARKTAAEGEDESTEGVPENAPGDEDDESSDEDEDPDDAKQAQRGHHALEAYDQGDRDDEVLRDEAAQEDPTTVTDTGTAATAAAAAVGRASPRDPDDIAQAAADELRRQEQGGGGRRRTLMPSPGGGGGGGKGKGASAGFLTEFVQDEGGRRVVVVITVSLEAPKLLLMEMAERVAHSAPIRAVPGIDKCYVVEAAGGGGGPAVQTDGINFAGAWESDDLIDVDKITCNDVSAMLRVFGVEAARATLVREVSSVFGAYGIGVDGRHLGLIADHMTQLGGYRPCNRIGMQFNPSPILKMSFETASQFLTEASVRGAVDVMASPASRIAVGRPVECGTGCIDILQPVLAPMPV